MKKFRLARLLRLKEEHANAKRLDWALAERDVASADEGLTRAKQQVTISEDELRRDLVQPRGSGQVQALLGAHQVLDTQREDIDVQRARLEEVRMVASAKRLESLSAKREVEALARLEHRWISEQKSRARRRAARNADEYIASKVTLDRTRESLQPRVEGGATSEHREMDSAGNDPKESNPKESNR